MRTLIARVIREFPHDYQEIAFELYKEMLRTSHGSWFIHAMPQHSLSVTLGPGSFFKRSENSCVFTNNEYMVHALKVI